MKILEAISRGVFFILGEFYRILWNINLTVRKSSLTHKFDSFVFCAIVWIARDSKTGAVIIPHNCLFRLPKIYLNIHRRVSRGSSLMKSATFIVIYGLALTLYGQTSFPLAESWHITQRQTYANTWQRVLLETNAMGLISSRLAQYQELGSGLNYVDRFGHWQSASPEFTREGDGFSAP